MKYPKFHGPESESEMLAMLYGQLACAWSMVAQYEADERKAESEAARKRFEKKLYTEKREHSTYTYPAGGSCSED